MLLLRGGVGWGTGEWCKRKLVVLKMEGQRGSPLGDDSERGAGGRKGREGRGCSET